MERAPAEIPPPEERNGLSSHMQSIVKTDIVMGDNSDVEIRMVGLDDTTEVTDKIMRRRMWHNWAASKLGWLSEEFFHFPPTLLYLLFVPLCSYICILSHKLPYHCLHYYPPN